MTSVDLGKGCVIHGLYSQLQPDFGPVAGSQQGHLFGIKTVRTRSDADASEVWQTVQNVKQGRKAGCRSIGVGERLEVGKKQ